MQTRCQPRGSGDQDKEYLPALGSLQARSQEATGDRVVTACLLGENSYSPAGLRNEPLSGNAEPHSKPIRQMDLSFIGENQNTESSGEGGSPGKRTEHVLVRASLRDCHLDGKAGFRGP